MADNQQQALKEKEIARKLKQLRKLDDRQRAMEAASKGLKGTQRLNELLTKLDRLLKQKYAFKVFKPGSINFGVMVTYRQKWEPESYQVGDLVSTIPLAPKEMRRYTTRTVVKKSRAQKEVDASLHTRRKESSDTARVESEIVERAQNKTNFTITANESIGGGSTPYTVGSTQSHTQDQSKESQHVKREFREGVLKSAQEYKQEHRTEIDVNESRESEGTNFQEIQNPNDELAVTYLFYELQRTYRISEKIHKLTPVIFVANEVPAPNEIDDAWLLKHDWILNRVILDDSFRPALEYLRTSFVGSEVNIRVLEASATLQKNLVLALRQQLQGQSAVMQAGQADVKTAVTDYAKTEQKAGFLSFFKGLFDPGGFTGDGDVAGVEAARTMADYAKESLDRAERARRELQSQLDVAVTALQAAVDKLSAAVNEHYAKVAEIDRLRLHIKENILYYMQAIWDHEPPDQRFFRLYDTEVPIVGVDATATSITLTSGYAASNPFGKTYLGSLPLTKVKVTKKTLVEVAHLDTLLGYKGNYMIFPLKENNYLTLHMMQDYLELGDVLSLRDPDEFADFTLDELEEFAACIRQRDQAGFEKQKGKIKQLMVDRLMSARKENELVVVPTSSLYVEALVGTHPLLEDFKLLHRALDVKKVQAEVRKAELENIRLAARALEGKRDDPDVEKKIVVQGAAGVTVQAD